MRQQPLTMASPTPSDAKCSISSQPLASTATDHGTPAERTQAGDLLKRADHPDVLAMLQRAHGDETGELKGRIAQVLQSRTR